MVDPKVVELKVFNALPHMLIPVVTEPKKVPAALKWLLGEMEQRYQLFAKVNVRNIVGFNGRGIRRRRDSARSRPARFAHRRRSDAGRRRRGSRPPALHRRHHRRARRPHDGRPRRDRNEHRPARPARPRRRHPPHHRHPAPFGERHHRRHQGQPSLPHRLPSRLAGRFPHDSRHQGRRHPHRPRRHVVFASRQLPVSSAPKAPSSPTKR